MSTDNPKNVGHAGKRKARNSDKLNGNLMVKHCMIHGAGNSSEEFKVLSDIFIKWSAMWPSKYHKHGNSITNKLDNIVTEAVEGVINYNDKVNFRKVKFFET